MLNSQLYKDSSGAPLEAAAQDEWLGAALAGHADATGHHADKDDDAGASGYERPSPSLPAEEHLHRRAAAPPARWTAVLSHIPPFINSPDEPDGYFPLPKAVRTPLLRRCCRHGVTHWFAGHYHRNAGGVFVDTDAPQPEADAAADAANAGGRNPGSIRSGSGGSSRGGASALAARTLEVVTTAAVGGNIETDPAGDPLGLSGMRALVASPARSGFRLVHVGPLGLQHRFVPLAAPANPAAPAGASGGGGFGNGGDLALTAGDAAALLPPASGAMRRRGERK